MLEGQADLQPRIYTALEPWLVCQFIRARSTTVVPGRSARNAPCCDGFRALLEQRAIDIIHRDLLTSGGMLETKQIADDGERFGLPTALHVAGSPIGFTANVHCAATIPSFVALEQHGLDLPCCRSLSTRRTVHTLHAQAAGRFYLNCRMGAGGHGRAGCRRQARILVLLKASEGDIESYLFGPEYRQIHQP